MPGLKSWDHYKQPAREAKTHHAFAVPGRYSGAYLALPPDLDKHREWLCRLAATVFEAGYRGFNDMLGKLVQSRETDLSASLYGHLRRAVNSANALDGVLFASPDDGRIVYLLDMKAVETVNDTLIKTAAKIKEGPQQALLELLNMSLPRARSQSQLLVSEGKEMDIRVFDFKKKLSDSETALLEKAEKAVYETAEREEHNAVAMIIAQNRDTFLNVWCPVSRMAEVLPILKREQRTLRKLFLELGS